MAETLTLTITGADQHRFNATLYPTDDCHAPILLFLSALGTPSRVYGRLGREMTQHGVQVCTPDWRGIGSSSIRAGRASDFGYRHLVELDLAALIETVHQGFPEAPIWLGGHSLGGQLALLGAAVSPDRIAGVVMIASGSVHLPCYSGKLRWGVRTLTYLSRIAGPVLGYFPGSRIGFGGREAAGLMRDWSHVALTGEYRPLGSDIDYENSMRSIKLPILAITFAADAWSPALAAKTLLNKLSANSPVHWHWSKSDTAGIAVDHYSWIKQPALVAPAVAQFIHRDFRSRFTSPD
jgi:predicted alpha/beta hydrolase